MSTEIPIPENSNAMGRIELKLDNVRIVQAESNIVMSAHIQADKVAFEQIFKELGVIKKIRIEIWVAISIMSAIMGAVEAFRILRMIP